MNKKMIAILAAMVVLTGTMAFAANNAGTPQRAMTQYSQQSSYCGKDGRHGQHMFRLSDRGKARSTSMWDSMCNFFGMHRGHGSHKGFANRNHGGGHGYGNSNGYGGRM